MFESQVVGYRTDRGCLEPVAPGVPLIRVVTVRVFWCVIRMELDLGMQT